MTAPVTETNQTAQEHSKVFKLLADAVQEHLHQGMDADQVRDIAQGVVDIRLSELTVPRPIEVRLSDGTTNVLQDNVHAQLDELLMLVDEGHKNMLMVGPAGSGKSTIAHNLADGLGLEFGMLSLSGGVTETHLFGRSLPQSDGTWKFVQSLFVDIYEHGGVFLLDEVDAADPNVMVAINAALANGKLALTDGRIVHRHEKCFILAAANTWCTGGDHMYVGRNQLDAATLDRFVLATMYITYDEALESRLLGLTPASKHAAKKSLCQAATPEQIRDWVLELRESIKRCKLRRVASTRLIVAANMAARAGRSMDQIKDRFFASWSADEKAKVL